MLDTFRPTETTYLLIDGVALHHASRANGISVDFKRLLQWLRERTRLVRAIYFTALVEEDDEVISVKPLVDWLDYNGYMTVTKAARIYSNEDGTRRVKGSMNVEIAMMMAELAGIAEHIVLASGDADLIPAVKYVQQRGSRVSVISTLHSRPPCVSDDLRRQTDDYIDIVSIEKHVARMPPQTAAVAAE